MLKFKAERLWRLLSIFTFPVDFGSDGRLYRMVTVVAIVNLCVFPPVLAEEPEARPARWSHFRPYIPERRDYGFELGAMWEENNLYWLGAQVGFHLGRCVFSDSQTCQQYFDLIGGVGGREGLTVGSVLTGLRWQFVGVPVYFSPSWSLLGGMVSQRGRERDRVLGTMGLGFGLTTSVHERVDLKWETRVGQSDRPWAQTFVSFMLKMDQWVDYFAKKFKKLGEGTLDASGRVIKHTIKAPIKAMDFVSPKESSDGAPGAKDQ